MNQAAAAAPRFPLSRSQMCPAQSAPSGDVRLRSWSTLAVCDLVSEVPSSLLEVLQSVLAFMPQDVFDHIAQVKIQTETLDHIDDFDVAAFVVRRAVDAVGLGPCSIWALVI